MKNDIFLKPLLKKPSKLCTLRFPKINLDGVKGVLIDFDDTLYSFAYPHWVAMHRVHRLFRKHLDYAAFERAFTLTWENSFKELGNVPSAHQRMTIFQRIAEEKGMERPFLIGARAYRLYFKAAKREIARQKINPDVLAFLKDCRRRQIPVCMVTDLFAVIQVEKLQALGLEKYIDFMVANDEVGADKPHPDMFLRALAKLKVDACDAIMIGDHLEKDVEGARKLGIKTYWVDPGREK